MQSEAKGLFTAMEKDFLPVACVYELYFFSVQLSMERSRSLGFELLSLISRICGILPRTVVCLNF